MPTKCCDPGDLHKILWSIAKWLEKNFDLVFLVVKSICLQILIIAWERMVYDGKKHFQESIFPSAQSFDNI